MKKIVLLIFVFMFSAVLSSCENIADNKQISASADYDTLLSAPAAECFGEEKETVLEKMGLTDEDLTESEAQGLFYLNKKGVEEVAGFTSYFLFGKIDGKDKCLYGFGYQYLCDASDETALNITQNLLEELVQKYGEPSTYPDLSNRIINIESISNYKPGNDCKEIWNVSGEKFHEIKLSLACVGERGERFKINIEYQ